MTIALTLIANPEVAPLEELVVQRIRTRLSSLGGYHNGGPRWLSEGEACELIVDDVEPEAAEAAARALLRERPVDVIVQPEEGRRKKLLMADMESTIIAQEMLDELGAEIGLGDRIRAITAQAMNGEIDFKQALTERVGLLAGVSVEVLEKLAGTITYNPGAKGLISTMRSRGAATVLVSGGFRYFTRQVSETLGFESERGNELEIVDGKLTGRLKPPVRDKEDKLAALIEEAEDHDIPLEATMAVGDGANDLPMLMAAGFGVAWHAKPSVREAARWRIDHTSLLSLLFVQGYRRQDCIDDRD